MKTTDITTKEHNATQYLIYWIKLHSKPQAGEPQAILITLRRWQDVYDPLKYSLNNLHVRLFNVYWINFIHFLKTKNKHQLFLRKPSISNDDKMSFAKNSSFVVSLINNKNNTWNLIQWFREFGTNSMNLRERWLQQSFMIINEYKWLLLLCTIVYKNHCPCHEVCLLIIKVCIC